MDTKEQITINTERSIKNKSDIEVLNVKVDNVALESMKKADTFLQVLTNLTNMIDRIDTRLLNLEKIHNSKISGEHLITGKCKEKITKS